MRERGRTHRCRFTSHWTNWANGGTSWRIASMLPTSRGINPMHDAVRLVLKTTGLCLLLMAVPSSPSAQSLPPFGSPVSLPARTNPHSVTIADLNLDGRLDLAAANSGASVVSVWLGNGDLTFGARLDFATGGRRRASRLAI